MAAGAAVGGASGATCSGAGGASGVGDCAAAGSAVAPSAIATPSAAALDLAWLELTRRVGTLVGPGRADATAPQMTHQRAPRAAALSG